MLDVVFRVCKHPFPPEISDRVLFVRRRNRGDCYAMLGMLGNESRSTFLVIGTPTRPQKGVTEREGVRGVGGI